MVDSRYSGVGYEPPFEAPSDKDFMAAHIEALEAENKRLINIAGGALGFSEYQRDQDTVEVLARAFKKQSENYAKIVGERDRLRAKLVAMVESASNVLKLLPLYGHDEIDAFKAAIDAAKAMQKFFI